MKRGLWGLLIFALAATVASAEEAKHPWGSFKPGSWVQTRLRTVVEADGKKRETVLTAKSTLKEVTATEAVVESEVEMSIVEGGKENKRPGQKQTVRWPLKPEKGVAPKDEGTKQESGEDVIPLLGKPCPCKWTKVVSEAAGSKTVAKTWTSDAVPGFTVRMESKTEGKEKIESTTEVVGFEAK
ncbi:MAG: hypothetical protein HYZ53_11740 [Planctomycetes bacterium]|nr:hypothetical protein [Planctomycetota bacterium]